MFKKKIITGCEARGDAQNPYLTRYTLLSTRSGKLLLHVFHRSDADDHHDHPWDFWTLILWRGYIECTDGVYPLEMRGQKRFFRPVRRRLWPLMLIYRRAEWSHRVELVNEKTAVTLVWIKQPRREWGFFTWHGWQRWRDYFRDNGC